MSSLPRVRSGLLRHPLDSNVLVYDSRDDRVHLLDATTACVIDILDAGEFDEAGAVAELARRLEVAPNPDLLELALDELAAAGLLDTPVIRLESDSGVSRRDVVRKLAAAGIAGVLVPTIATLSASRAYAQGTLAGVGTACQTNGACQSGRCCGGQCVDAACSSGNSNCGSGVNPGQGQTVIDCTCCSGTCTQTGASENSQKCT